MGDGERTGSEIRKGSITKRRERDAFLRRRPDDNRYGLWSL